MNLKEPQLGFAWITSLKADENFLLPDNSPQRRGNGTPVSENFTTKLHIGEMAKFDSQFVSPFRIEAGQAIGKKEGVVPRDWPYPISVFAGLDWGRLYSHSVSMAYTHSRLVTLRFFNGLFLVVLYQSLGSPVIPLKGTASATYLSVGP